MPKDIVICDWHYDTASPTPSYFALKGFNVVICSYNKPHIGVAEVDDMVRIRAGNRENKQVAPRLLGVMATNWGKSEKFADSYRAAKASGQKADMPTVENFIRVFERVRQQAATPVEPLPSGKP